MNARQAERLSGCPTGCTRTTASSCSSCWCRPSRRSSSGGRRRRPLRHRDPPGPHARAIAEIQEAGIEPDIWKIEGIDEARGLREDRRAGARRRARERGVRGARPGRRRRRGGPLAADRRGRTRIHRVRHRADDLVGRAQGRIVDGDGSRRGDGEDLGELPTDDRRVHSGAEKEADDGGDQDDRPGGGVDGVVARRGAAGAGRGRQDASRDRGDGHPRHERGGEGRSIAEYHTHVQIAFRIER